MVRKAIILSAGQGSRLLPMTEALPKCLLPLSAMSVLEWQINRLVDCGISEIVVVTGFYAEKVEERLVALRAHGINARALFNPFFKVADNLGSCWLARDEMSEDFVLLNGDTIFETPVLGKLLAKAAAPITLTIDCKEHYDSDDMKVQLNGDALTAIGKDLPLDAVDGESIGMLCFKGKGPALFKNALEAAMRQPQGTSSWYLRVIGAIAREAHVGTVSINGLEWGEIDYPMDLENARRLTRGWLVRESQTGNERRPAKAASA